MSAFETCGFRAYATISVKNLLWMAVSLPFSSGSLALNHSRHQPTCDHVISSDPIGREAVVARMKQASAFSANWVDGDVMNFVLRREKQTRSFSAGTEVKPGSRWFRHNWLRLHGCIFGNLNKLQILLSIDINISHCFQNVAFPDTHSLRKILIFIPHTTS